MNKIQSIRGMNDLLPVESSFWEHVEQVLARVAGLYGYQEIRTPIIEHTALFERSIGEATDIVEKEMYTFTDKGGDSLTMRPENTASVIRAGLEHGLFHHQNQKLWYLGPMFRHERPQKGRYRQFHQFGCEAIGWEGPQIDAELIQLTARLWKHLCLKGLVLEINTIGTSRERWVYREHLVKYFNTHIDQLDEDSRRRLISNPLRIFDSKVGTTQAVVTDAPQLQAFLSDESRKHFDAVCEQLVRDGIEYRINPRLVRGLDYYSLTVFEWVTDQLGAQNAVLAGGRYDGLVEQLGGKPTPGIGFAMGIERLLELVRLSGSATPAYRVQVYIINDNTSVAINMASALAEQVRDKGLNALVHFGAGSIKSQFKKADQSGADIAIVIGEDEVSSNLVTIKPLRTGQPQAQLPYSGEMSPELLSTLLKLTVQ